MYRDRRGNVARNEVTERSLADLITTVEEVAAGLHTYRNRLQYNTTPITTVISEVFGLSSTLREINEVDRFDVFSSSSPFYQVQNDLNLLFPSLRRTLSDVLEMFGLSRNGTEQREWDKMNDRMLREESMDVLERCQVYHTFLRAQADILQGRPTQRQDGGRRAIALLLDAQEVSVLERERLVIEGTVPTTPRPRHVRTRSAVEMPAFPISPISSEGRSDYTRVSIPPFAPDPPYRRPPSPIYTSSPPRTFESSQTAYSDQWVHWAQDVFDGRHPATPFAQQYLLADRSRCWGRADNYSLESLRIDGFVQAIEIPFDRDTFLLRLYFRPEDSRTRVLLIARDSRGRESHYCKKAVNLKVVREASSLLLSKYEGDGRFRPWARLNFNLYERMVLFYCTFVAMKKQDSHPLPHADLIDDGVLEQSARPHESESEVYGGVVSDGDLQHALRLYRDRPSGAVRLEASAHRGPMKNVPLWTAFLTRYAGDPDHVAREQGAVVSFIAMRPPPYVFLRGYRPPMNAKGEYILQFTTYDDAEHFVEVWTRLCRESGR